MVTDRSPTSIRPFHKAAGGPTHKILKLTFISLFSVIEEFKTAHNSNQFVPRSLSILLKSSWNKTWFSNEPSLLPLLGGSSCSFLQTHLSLVSKELQPQCVNIFAVHYNLPPPYWLFVLNPFFISACVICTLHSCNRFPALPCVQFINSKLSILLIL